MGRHAPPDPQEHERRGHRRPEGAEFPAQLHETPRRREVAPDEADRQKKITQIADRRPRIVIHRQDASLLVGVVGGLEEAESPVIQDVVHVDVVGEGGVALPIDDRHVARIGRGAHRTRIALQLETIQPDGEGKSDRFGAVVDPHMQIAEIDNRRLPGGRTESVDPDPLLLIAVTDAQDQSTGMAVVGFDGRRSELHPPFGGEGAQDERNAPRRIEHPLLQRVCARREGAALAGRHRKRGEWERTVQRERAVFFVDLDGGFFPFGRRVEGEYHTPQIESFPLRQRVLRPRSAGGDLEERDRLALGIGDDPFLRRRNVALQSDLHRLVPDTVGPMETVAPHRREIQRRIGKGRFVPLAQLDSQHHHVADHPVARLAVAQVQDPLIAEITGRKGPDRHDDQPQVEGELAPFFALPHPETEDVVDHRGGEIPQQNLEPPGVVDQRAGRFGPVVVFDKGGRPDGDGEDQHQRHRHFHGKDFLQHSTLR